MKKDLLLLSFLACITLSGCQPGMEELTNGAQQAVEFESPHVTKAQNVLLLSTVDEVSTSQTPFIQGVLRVLLDYRGQPWQDGIAALNHLASGIDHRESTAADARYQLEFIAFSSLEFLDQAEAGDADQAAAAAKQFLEEVMERSTPIDWRALSRLYVHAESGLSANERATYLTYIEAGATGTLKSPCPPDTPESRHDMNQWQAADALNRLVVSQ